MDNVKDASDTRPVDRPSISAEDLGRFWSSQGIDSKCKECRKEDWIGEGMDETSPSIAYFRRGGPISKSIPLLVLVCSNCGCVRPFSRIVIEDWLRDNPA
jgi:hypothetical protein